MNRVKSHRSSCAPFDARLALIAILLAAAFAAPLSTAAVTPSTQPGPGSTVTAVAVPPASSGQPNFGANVYIFAPSTPQGTIQATVDAVASTQVSNQFGTQRYAFLFEPGTYGSSANPLIFQSAITPPSRASAFLRAMSPSTAQSMFPINATAAAAAP